METNLLQGKLVRLVTEDPETVAKYLSRWARNSEYWRLLSSDPARLRSTKSIKEWIEKEIEKEQPGFFLFLIRTLTDDRLIGDIGLGGINWVQGEAFVGIGLGEREDWGKGYGTDAMRIMLGYAFMELNLYRVSLNFFEYNPRALRSYEKSGFSIEGRERKFLNREGRRWDLIWMGILREEWEKSRLD
jgi:RimJ/RimL family protein N-acetyltransferase